jgi:hypothetical protein
VGLEYLIIYHIVLKIITRFKYSLKKFLQVGSFYSLDEYYEWKKRDDCVNYRYIILLQSLLIFYCSFTHNFLVVFFFPNILDVNFVF